MPRGTYQLPVQYTLDEGDGPFNGFAKLDLEESSFSFQPTWSVDPELDESIIEARSIVVGDANSPLRTDFGIPIAFFDESSIPV